MGIDYEGYRAKTDKAAVRERNEEVDRRHERWAREREVTLATTGRPNSLSRLLRAVRRSLGRG